MSLTLLSFTHFSIFLYELFRMQSVEVRKRKKERKGRQLLDVGSNGLGVEPILIPMVNDREREISEVAKRGRESREVESRERESE